MWDDHKFKFKPMKNLNSAYILIITLAIGKNLMNGTIKAHSIRSLEDQLAAAYNAERRKQASGEPSKELTIKHILPPYLAYFYGTNERSQSRS